MSEPAEVRRALHRFALARDRLNVGLARAAGLSQSDLLALEHLEEAGDQGLSPGELGAALALTSGAVTGVIDRLERAGWAVRRPHPRDRRSLHVVLGERAQDEAARAVGGYERDLDDVIAGLAPRERAAVRRFLDGAATAAEKHARAFWEPSP